MTLREMRRELRAMLDAVPADRPPALRRSRREDALLSTDLPQCAAPEAVDAFAARAASAGWRVLRAGDRLELDRTPDQPDVPPRAGTGEAACLISLLERHPGPADDPAALRALMKAEEEGPEALERLAARLHAEWAARLRRGEELPGRLLPWLYATAKEDGTC